MFLIFGINQNEKQLNFDQTVICKGCGRFGHIAVWMRYTYFMLFFIPLFKWGRTYYVQMSCCGSTCELDPALGRGIETGSVTSLDERSLHFGCQEGTRRCTNCGYTTAEDFQYCPKCGRLF